MIHVWLYESPMGDYLFEGELTEEGSFHVIIGSVFYCEKHAVRANHSSWRCAVRTLFSVDKAVLVKSLPVYRKGMFMSVYKKLPTV